MLNINDDVRIDCVEPRDRLLPVVKVACRMLVVSDVAWSHVAEGDGWLTLGVRSRDGEKEATIAFVVDDNVILIRASSWKRTPTGQLRCTEHLATAAHVTRTCLERETFAMRSA